MSSMLPTLIASEKVGRRANEDPSFLIKFGIGSIAFASLGIASYYVLGFALGYSTGWSVIFYKTSYPNYLKYFVWVLAIFFALCGLVCIVSGRRRREKEIELRTKIYELSGEGVSAKEFLENRSSLKRNGDITGVYILHNKSKDIYYVGQSVKAVDRAAAHLLGCGNGDVYADFKHGAEFEISLIPLSNSGYNSLDNLESVTIKAYDAFRKGYNRTRGNKA